MAADDYQDYFWASVYDQYNRGRHEKELAFYSAELRRCRGPVLEVACGTGMILLKLLEQGIDIYGFDIAEEMLRVLFEHAETANIEDIHDRVSRQDMRDFHYDRTFEAIIIPARSFLHLTNQEDQIACLRAVRSHLGPKGRLLLNFFNPNVSLLAAGAESPFGFRPLCTFVHPATDEPVELSFRQRNDLPNQVQHIVWRFEHEGSTHETTMTVRWIFKEEFQLLLRLAGFEEWTLYGDFDKSEFGETSKELIWIVER